MKLVIFSVWRERNTTQRCFFFFEKSTESLSNRKNRNYSGQCAHSSRQVNSTSFCDVLRPNQACISLTLQAPQHNLVERMWVKEVVFDNVFLSSTPQIKRTVRAFLQHQNIRKSEIINHLCVSL